ncbi:MAG: serine/threonine-protein kinase [Hyphomicrobiaceae bacterium]|nr:serine/threonine-protein kinase [Hyphomicrobiaceae bacterium]
MTTKKPRRWKVGQTIGGSFTVLSVVDDKGPDPVYVVWHIAARCPMAVKRMRSEARARKEADMLMRLAHPNIVRCYGIAERTCVLMEFLAGPTIRRLIHEEKGGRLRLSDALRTAIHLAAALDYVHAHGFLHLDVKPRNVVVVHGRPVLFDFGIARPRPDWTKPRLQGTDPYMAPEQCRREPVSPATDVFALGVTLFEMLTGKAPFPDGTARREFPQLEVDAKRVREFRPGVPKAVETLVDACLAKDPRDRPTLPHLMTALHAHIRGGPPMWPAGFTPVTDAAKPRPRPPSKVRPSRPAPPAGSRPGRAIAARDRVANTP